MYGKIKTHPLQLYKIFPIYEYQFIKSQPYKYSHDLLNIMDVRMILMAIYLFMRFVLDKKFDNVRFYGTKIHQILDKEIFGLSQVNNSFFPLNRHY